MPLKDRDAYNKYMREYRQRKNMTAYDKQRRLKRKAEGKCIRCGKPLIDDEVEYCVWCVTNRNLPIIRGMV